MILTPNALGPVVLITSFDVYLSDLGNVDDMSVASSSNLSEKLENNEDIKLKLKLYKHERAKAKQLRKQNKQLQQQVQTSQ